jgi:hypothetical protein
MPLNRPRFDVYVNTTADDPEEYAGVTITHQDQLKAEAQLARAGIDPQGHALTLTTAWCWAALVRMDVYSGTFKRFYDTDCAGVETPADGETSDAVDPIHRAAGTASPSDSPASGPESIG